MTHELLPRDYQTFLHTIKTRVQQAQLHAVLAVNRELIFLYWQIGQEIWKRQQELGWGAKVIEQLSRDLHAAFPQMKGFSPRNLQYMRTFAEAYPDETQFTQQAVAQIPWGHHTVLLDKVEDAQERHWYIQQIIEHGWSRSMLLIHIETRLFQRKGKAITNFQTTLPALQSDLAQEALKDPYIFDFITTGEETKVGIILCKTKNKVMAEYALADLHKPIGIATYQFTTALPDALKTQLPTIADLEAQLKDVEQTTDQP